MKLRTLLLAVVIAACLPVSPASAATCTPTKVAVERFVPFTNRYKETIAVDLYLPADAAGTPLTARGCRFPVVLESSPYRDWITPQPTRTRQDEEQQRTWWVKRGYVFAFADVPGTGGSDGTWCMWCMHEQLSTVDIVEALGTKQWSNGRVAMFGGSYRGIEALLVAQHRPKALKALLIAATFNDPYTDMFFIGGMPRFEDSVALMAAFTGLDRWSGRYDVSDPERSVELFTRHATSPPAGFLRYQDEHPTRDAFWEERTVHPERITVPTYVLGGWADLFDRATWSLYDRLASKTKVLLQGPFSHYPLFMPEDAWPCDSESIDYCGAPFLDRHLRGKGSASYSAMVRRPVRSFIGPSGPYLATRGKPATTGMTFALGERGDTATMRYNPLAGVGAGRWFARGSVAGGQMPFDTYLGVDGPTDQRVEESGGVSVAVTAPLGKPVTLVGRSVASIVASSDRADADLVVRIVDEYPVGDPTFPLGHNTLIATGWLRASHRSGHTAKAIRPLVPGRKTRLNVEIWPTGYRVAKGHRIRVDLYPADTPRFFPQREPFALEVDLAASRVTLPRLRE